MQLSKQNLKYISSAGVVLPGDRIFSLPEKVLQFGTGVLLRGLPDFFIDKANRQGIFNGRIVVVKSTANGGTHRFDKQDALYTLCVKGIEQNKVVEEFIINSSVSRVLSARQNWSKVLECAYNPELKIIISNTTETGIVLTNDDIHLSPPGSFPGKLLSFLFERYKAFGGTKESGMIIIPTELITENGTKLRSIILNLAVINKLDSEFIKWLEAENHFCNSLVDRIVPGKLHPDDQLHTEKSLGYRDELMIMTEPFRLWAIESDDEEVKQTLSFSQADEGITIVSAIEKYRELKLRLLNGTHAFTCGLALLAGHRTVKEAMNDHSFSAFIYRLAIDEIAVVISNEKISYSEARNFADKVMDRFRNPFIDHQWTNIAVQYSSKMKMRNIPLLEKHYGRYSYVPGLMALGFAGYLLFMKCRKNEKGIYWGHSNSFSYPVQDDRASYFEEKWNHHNIDGLVDSVLADKEYWEADLSLLPGLAESIKENLHSLVQNGIMATINKVVFNQTVVR